jgi:hypothetical protein
VNNTVFTFVNAVLIRGLPFDDPDRIMSLGTRDARNRDRGLSYLEFQDWRDNTKAFTGMAAFSGQTMNVSDEGRAPERFAGPYISGNAFKLIGERPILGRDFLPEDDRPGAAPVVILGNGIWKNRYGSDRNVIGRTVKINELPMTVIGVMPEGFKFRSTRISGCRRCIWPDSPTRSATRATSRCSAVADGVAVARAQAELKPIADRLAHDFPGTNKDVKPTVMTFQRPLQRRSDPVDLPHADARSASSLLIACANVAASCSPGRRTAPARSRSASRSVRARPDRAQLLVESVLLALIARRVRPGPVDDRHRVVCSTRPRRMSASRTGSSSRSTAASSRSSPPSASGPLSSSGSRRRCTCRRPISTSS